MKHHNKLHLFGLLTLLLFAGCHSCSKDNNGGEEPTPPAETTSDVETYVTSQDGMRSFARQEVNFASVGMSPYKVTLDPQTRYQEVDGFGAALTGASCYNLQKMSSADRAAFLKATFDPDEGMGFSFLRLHIGGSDFSMDEYTCCDTEGIGFFDIPKIERDGIFPVLREILKINPEIKLLGSPWSCPRWMKGTVADASKPFNSWTSGRLNPKYYADYAEYFVKWCQEMEQEGFPIYAITMQNEPLNHGNSMSLYMPWQDQLAFVKVLGPAFEKAGVKAKILTFDHNYNYDNLASSNIRCISTKTPKRPNGSTARLGTPTAAASRSWTASAQRRPTSRSTSPKPRSAHGAPRAERGRTSTGTASSTTSRISSSARSTATEKAFCCGT